AFGTFVVTASPCPSWPSRLRPQHFTTPRPLMPQAWVQESATNFQLGRDEITFRAPELSAQVPSPTWPNRFRPQHQSEWSCLMAQVVQPSTDTELQCRPPPTRVGVVWFLVDPTPSWPAESSPQHHSEWLVRIAQVWNHPVLTCLQARAGPTRAGRVRTF